MRSDWRQMATGLMAALALTLTTATAQEAADCRQRQASDPPRTIYECANGIVVEAEAAVVLGLVEMDGEEGPAALDLGEGGVLIERRDGEGELQIRTPHAIASVRGTVFVVDVAPQATAVFVIAGAVAVARPDGSDEVVLADGEGVDVQPGQPLTVRRWPDDRVEPFLSRFGR